MATLSTHSSTRSCLVTGSSHVAMGENQTNKQRVNMSEEIVALMYPLCEAGKIDQSHLDSTIVIFRAYAMNLEGINGDFDGSYYFARQLASPAGFFQDRANHAGGVVTARTLGLTVLHTLVLFAKLDRSVWYGMFNVLGRPASPDDPTPMETGRYDSHSLWRRLLREERAVSQDENWTYPGWLMEFLVHVVAEYFRTSGATSISTVSAYKLMNAALKVVLDDVDLPGVDALMVESTPGGKPIGLARQFKVVLEGTCSPSSTNSRTWIPNTVTPRGRAHDEEGDATSVESFIVNGGVSSAVMGAKARLSRRRELVDLEGSSKTTIRTKRKRSSETKIAGGIQAHETRRRRQIQRDGAGTTEVTCLRCVEREETNPYKKSYSNTVFEKMKQTKVFEREGKIWLRCPICRAAGVVGTQHRNWKIN